MRIATKLTLAVAIILLIVGMVGLLVFNRLRDAAETSVETEAKNVAATMSAMAAYSMKGAADDSRHPELQNIVNFIAKNENRDIEIFDANLIDLADGDIGDVGKPIEPERRAVAAMTLRDGVARTLLESGTAISHEKRQVAVPIRNDARKIVAVLIFEYTPLYNELSALIRNTLVTIAALGLCSLIFASGCGMFVSRWISKPLRQLRDAAAELAIGKRSVSVNFDSNDELGELAETFNKMSVSLEAFQSKLEDRANELARTNHELNEEMRARIRTEQALHLRQRAIESSFNAIVITNLTRPDHPIEYVNQAFERITGYSAKEVIGLGASFMVGDELEQPALKEIQLAMHERRPAHAVLRSYRKNGQVFWNEIYIAPVRNADGPTEHFVTIFNDITDAKNDAENVARQAHFDPLTELANRSLLQDRLNQAIAGSQRRNSGIAVAFIDLDNFKLINDSLGHDVGDELLKAVATRLQSCVRASDTVARLGGDEFVLLLTDQTNHGEGMIESHVTELVRKLLANVSEPLMLAGREIRMSCSIGVGMYPQDGEDAETLLKNADTAMYRAKELGRDRFQFFTAALQERVQKQLELGASLRRALERDEFRLFYQPQVSLHNGRVVGMEALLRWQHPEQGLIGPGHFIAFAEESGLIISIGEWVLMEACRQNKAWQDAGLPAIPVAVNVSAKQCAQQDLEAVVRRALKKSGLQAQFLELELTESISMADPEKSVPLMERMKEIGVELSIDDFGTGYSNMSYLKRFPIDRLKLDISFVREITTDTDNLAISEAIITMSHSLRLEVVAEGVETEGQLAVLKGLGCDLIQGFYFSKPLPVAELERFLLDGRHLQLNTDGNAGSPPALLVLDDDANMRNLLQVTLESEGYSMHITGQASDAFEILACHEVAVVLCDQRMPEMNGVEFLGRVKYMYPKTVRIMLSAYEDYNVTRQAINMGAVYKYMEKPVRSAELKIAVKDAYARYLTDRNFSRQKTLPVVSEEM
jgi:diguanylate cyclase (GGDEF)-like protein/PAS domain S-box-containing protein